MCNPTTGSPTITLCQLRPNHYSVFNLPKNYTLNDGRFKEECDLRLKLEDPKNVL